MSKVTVEALRLCAPVGITAGLATLFFGISSEINKSVNVWAGAILVALGLIFLFIYLNYVKSNDK
jgi:hypothetical protein